MRVGISVTLQFRVEDSARIREDGVGNVVVANDEVYAVTAGIGDFVDCFDTTIKHNNQFYTRFDSVVYALYRDAIAFFVARRNVVLHVGVVVT